MRIKLNKIIALTLIFALMIGGVCGCSKQKNKLIDIKQSKEITVWTNATFPPYEFIGENGDIIGIDIDIAKEIAKELGVEVKIKNTEFNSIITSIRSDKGDIGIAGITIDSDRRDIVDFSIAYAESVQCLIVKEDSVIRYFEDLEGKKVGGEMGNVGYIIVEDQINHGMLKGKNSKIKPYNSSVDAMLGLTTNKIDAVVADKTVSEELISLKNGYKAIDLIDKKNNDYKGEFGIIIKKGNNDLLKVINQVISRLKETGQLDIIKDKYINIMGNQ